jgi:cell division protein FtsL
MLVAERYQIEKSDMNTGAEIKRKARIRLKRAVLIKTVAVFVGLVFLNSVIQALVVQKNHEITVQRNEIQALDRELNKLQIEIASLASYDRIQNLAKTKLGMKLATPEDYRRIAAVPSVDHTTPDSYRQSLWSRVAAWVAGAGETMANTP